MAILLTTFMSHLPLLVVTVTGKNGSDRNVEINLAVLLWYLPNLAPKDASIDVSVEAASCFARQGIYPPVSQ
jgi:hypothetical protein